MAKFSLFKKSLLGIVGSMTLILCLCMSCSDNSKGDHTHSSHQPVLMDVDFDTSLGLHYNEFQSVGSLPLDKKRLSMFGKLWEKNRPSKVELSAEYKIPKIIHQIWLGPKKQPAMFKKWEETWKQLHPDWEYHLWTDADLPKLNLDLQDLMDKSSNYGQKADILRCELLERFGGIYVDVDFDCFKPFDEIARRYDFFASFEPPLPEPRFGMTLQICNSIIGACPHHPILKRWKETMRAVWDKAGNQGLNRIDTIFFRTYNTFGQSIEECLDKGGYTNIVFPPTYMWPISNKWIAKYRKTDGKPENIFKRVLTALHLRSPAPFSQPQPETMALHYNTGSWVGSPNDQLAEMQSTLENIRDQLEKLRVDLQPILQQNQLQAEASDPS